MIRFLLLLALLLPVIVQAEDTLRVGIKLSEPWIMYDESKPVEERNPFGFSIDLWEEISHQLGRKTEWVYYDSTHAIIDAVENKKVVAGIAAITVTAEREKRIDFSNSMYELGLQIMVSTAFQQASPFRVMFREMARLFTWKTVLSLLAMLLVTAHIRLWIDRHNGVNAFMPPGYFNGLRESLWWGLTMLLTWETPHSRGWARVIDLGWHLIGLILLSIVTAVVTSALTAQAVSGTIRSEKDLPGKVVTAVATDAPRQWLEQNGFAVTPVENIAEGIERVRKGEADALVHDGLRLVYLANQINQKEGRAVLAVVPASFNPQSYGIAFPEDSTLRESVNQILMQLREAQGGNNSFHQQLREKWIQN